MQVKRSTAGIHSHHVAAIVLALVGWSSLSKFPGISGWLGAAGCFLLAITLFVRPDAMQRSSRGATAAMAAGLLLMAASVVIWALQR